MDPTQALITQGGLGLLAAVLLWLYLAERKEHREDRKADLAQIAVLQEARRVDAVETRDNVTTVLSGISQNLDQINTKIIVGKANAGGS